MGFHIRKTKKIGMFNLNLSNSGIGTSFGVKGFRIGIDGKGRAYIGGGKGMFRFREYLSTSTKKAATPQKADTVSNEVKIYESTKPNMFNSFRLKGFGIVTNLFKTLFCGILSILIFFLFTGLGALIAEKHPFGTILLFLFGLGSIGVPWEFIYKPQFIKLADEGFKLYLKNDLNGAIALLEQSQNEINISKYYISTYKFDEWLHDTMYECYLKLDQKEKALNLLENTIIISDKDERILNLYEQLNQFDKMLKYLDESDIIGKREKKVQILHKLERWDEVINVLQKEYSQEEKDEHPSVYGVLAEAFLKLNQPQIAIDCLLQGPINVRKMSSDMCAFRYALGECYEAIGDIESAKKQYSKIYAYDAEFEDVKEKMNL